MLKFTYSSLPKFRDIVSLLSPNILDFKNLAAPWTSDNDKAIWFSRSAWSIYFLAKYRMAYFGKRKINIWLPDYFCNESLFLLRKLDVNFTFYTIKKNGQPNEELFSNIIEENKPDLFLIVHFFGQLVSCNGLLSFCDSHKTWLVEDATHVLYPINGIGQFGDFVLYSPHKLLPIPDGAILVVRHNGPNNFTNDDYIFNSLDQFYNRFIIVSKVEKLIIFKWVIKRLIQRLGIRPKIGIPDFFNYSENLMPKITTAKMSNVSIKLLERYITQLVNTAQKREACANAWKNLLGSIFPNNFTRNVQIHGTPYMACFESPNIEKAKKLYDLLKLNNFPVSTWPDLPPEVLNNSVCNNIAIELRNTRIYLPVHDSVSIKKISSSESIIRNSYCANWKIIEIKSNSEWYKYWDMSDFKTLTQAWEYGSAKENAEEWKALRYLILDEKNKPIALFQVLIKKYFGINVAARVNKGPIMLNVSEENKILLGLTAIHFLVEKLRKNKYFLIQIAPLLPPTELVEKALNSMGFRKCANVPMDSALFLLEGIEDELIMRLNGKWRNCLRKGQKLGVIVELDKEPNSKQFQILIDFYKAQQVEKKFKGTSENILRELKNIYGEKYKFNFFIAKLNLEIIGILVTIQYGDFSEYLIGATNEQGRANQANSVLLWEAILEAKRNGCKWFDVGGLAMNTQKGIADFKKGLNPVPYKIVGEWRRWL
jgi:lipid II:glycine glycyltransferase (peptidoglycan interpeptide bridge formation enzyme)